MGDSKNSTFFFIQRKSAFRLQKSDYNMIYKIISKHGEYEINEKTLIRWWTQYKCKLISTAEAVFMDEFKNLIYK